MLNRIRKTAGNVKNHVERNKVHYLWAGALVVASAAWFNLGTGRAVVTISWKRIDFKWIAASEAWSNWGRNPTWFN